MNKYSLVFIQKRELTFIPSKPIRQSRKEDYMSIPNDPVMLLSYINTQLRDFYPNLKDLCLSLNIDEKTLCSKLETIDYRYDETLNQFV